MAAGKSFGDIGNRGRHYRIHKLQRQHQQENGIQKMSVSKTHKEHTESNGAVVPIRLPDKSSSSQKTAPKHLETLRKIRPPQPQRDSVLSCRYELKYRIRETKARAIAQYIQSYISPDKYSKLCPDYQYLISSLYFDSNDLHLCKETIGEKTNRFKLRIRCYDDKPDTPCFFEIKRRLNNVILKDRARLSKDLITKIVRDYYVPEKLYTKDRDILLQFQLYLRALQARPVVLVRYRRQAFEDDSCNRVRITFDRGLSFKSADAPVLITNGAGWDTVPMDFVILEIKFTNRYPVWLNDMVKIFDLKQTAMSKYVSSVKQSCTMGYCGPLCQTGV